MKDVRTAVRQQLDSWSLRGVESEAELDLARVYTECPRPGGAHPYKSIFFCPKSRPGSTVMFPNYEDGWSSLARGVSKLLPGRAFLFGLGSVRTEWPLYRFEMVTRGEALRHVSVIKDVDKWKFWQTGKPLPEEDAAVYRKRRIRDRLTREYLVSLAEGLDFPIGDDRFWESDSKAVYFEQHRVAQRPSPSTSSS